jgi:predicted transposase/invertase (TIGR01784 family)
LKGDSPEEKLAILDVLIRTKQGKRVNVEIQVHEVPFMKERITGYTAKMVGAQVQTGEEWGEIKKVISIVILDYNLIKDSDCFHNKYMLYDRETNSLFTDALEVHTLELRKLPLNVTPEMEEKVRQQILWLRMIKTEREEEMKMLATKNPEIEKAYRVLKELSASEDVRLLYAAREKALWDQQAREHFARKEGHAEGRAEGRAEGHAEGRAEEKRDNALNLLRMGLTVEQVAQGTRLSVEEVEALQKQATAAPPAKRKPGRPPRHPRQG